jgi:cytochrome c peroxidase
MRTNPMPFVLGLLVLSLFAGAAGAQGPPPPPPLQPLPPPPQPAENPVTTAKANLGKVLFWDEQLSSTRTVACGSCHQAATGGSDPRSTMQSAHAHNPGFDGVFGTADDIVGSPGVQQNQADGTLVWSTSYGYDVQTTGRHAPSNINAAYVPELFWDGRASATFTDPVSGTVLEANRGALESQASAPPVASIEMAHLGRSWTDVATRVGGVTPLALSMSVPSALTAWIANRGYGDLFQEAFGTAEITASRILMAIGSYERTLVSNQAPFDSLIAGTTTLRPDEQAGFVLFGQINCARCHGGALTSDNAFHNTGVRPALEDSGRAIVTHNPADAARFKTSILRNVGLRKAYFHNGRLNTLADVVDFYDRGGDFNAPNKDPLIVPLGLTAAQKASLVAFMGRPLTDPRVAAGTFPFDQPALFSEGGFVPRVLTGGVAGASGSAPQAVALEPPLAGNPAFTVGVFGALGGASATLVVDDAVPALNGGIPANGTFAYQSVMLSGSQLNDGRGSVSIAIPDDPSLYGHVLYARWYVADPAAPGGVAASAPVQFTIFGPHGAGVSTAGLTPPAASGAVRLYGSEPNPFRTSALVRFDLATPTRVSLSVYDVAGRLQRRLYRNAMANPGAYAVPWDGRDDHGQAVAAGLYFYRLETERDVRTARTVRVP